MSYRPLRIIDAVPPMEDWPPMAARLGGNRAIIFGEMDENGKIHEKMKEFKPGWMSLMFEGQVYDWYGKRAKVCPDEDGKESGYEVVMPFRYFNGRNWDGTSVNRIFEYCLVDLPRYFDSYVVKIDEGRYRLASLVPLEGYLLTFKGVFDKLSDEKKEKIIHHCSRMHSPEDSMTRLLRERELCLAFIGQEEGMTFGDLDFASLRNRPIMDEILSLANQERRMGVFDGFCLARGVEFDIRGRYCDESLNKKIRDFFIDGAGYWRWPDTMRLYSPFDPTGGSVMIRVCEQRETMIDKMKTECGFEFYERLDYTKLTDYYAYGNLIFGEPEFSEDGRKVTFRILKPFWGKSSWREKELTEKDLVRVSCDMDIVEMLRETEVGEHCAVNYARVLSCYREP